MIFQDWVLIYIFIGMLVSVWHWREASPFVWEHCWDHVLSILIWPIIPIGHIIYWFKNRK